MTGTPYKIGIVVTGTDKGATKVLRLTQKELRALNQKFGQGRRQMAGYQREIKSTSSQLLSLRGYLLAGIGGLAGLGSSIIGVTAEYQNLRTRIQGVIGTGAVWAETQKYLAETANRQSQDLLGLTDRYSQLLPLVEANIISVSDARGILEGYNDVAAKTGVGNDDLARSLVGLSQGLSAGTLQTQDFKQAVASLPGFMQKFDKQVAHTGKTFKQLIAEGKVTAEFYKTTFLAALQDYAGAAEATANNLTPTWNRVKTEYQQLVLDFEKPVSSGLLFAMQNGIPLIREFGGQIIPLGAAYLLYSQRARLASIGTGSFTTSLSNQYKVALKAAAKQRVLNASIKGSVLSVTQATTAQRIMTASTVGLTTAFRALKAALWPAGAILLATEAIYHFATSEDSATDGAQQLKSASEKLTQVLNNNIPVTRKAAEATLKEAQAHRQAALDTINHAKAQLALRSAKYDESYSNDDPVIDGVASGEIEAHKAHLVFKQETKGMEDALAVLEKNIQSAKTKIIGMPKITITGVDGIKEVSESYQRIHDKLYPLQRLSREYANTQSKIKEELRLGTITKKESSDALARLAVEYEKNKQGLVKNTTARRAATGAGKQLNQILQEGRSLTESLRSPQEIFTAQMQRLNELREKGAITQETYNRAVAKYQEELEKANQSKGGSGIWEGMQAGIDTYGDKVKSVMETTKDLTSQVMGGMESAVMNFVETGKLSFEDLGKSILKTFLKLSMNKWIKSIFSGFGGGGGGILGNILGSLFHTGGIVGGSSVMAQRPVNPVVFAGAPRMHLGGMVGGLKSGEQPIIAMRGEGLFTREQMANLAPAGRQMQSVKVEVINRGTPQRADESQTRFDPKSGVVQIVLEDLNNNGPVAQGITGMMGKSRGDFR